MKSFTKLVTIISLHETKSLLFTSPRPFLASTCSSTSLDSTSPYLTNLNEAQVEKNIRSDYVRNLEDRLASIEGPASVTGSQYDLPSLSNQVFDKILPLKVQGGSLRTWTYNSPAVEAVIVAMKTEGRPLDADIELWQGPDNTPHKMRVYVEDGAIRPFSCMIATPRGPNTVSIRNIGNLEFPLQASVAADTPDIVRPSVDLRAFKSEPLLIQGGALRTYPFDPSVESVQVVLTTDGRPLNSRIELLQGPNNIKQVIELYTEDGLDRPFMIVLETPGSGNVIRIVNTSTVEFPLTAGVEAYTIDAEFSDLDPVLGGDTNVGFR